VHTRGGYRELFVVMTLILDHKYGHYVRPNRVGHKYPDLKKYVDLDAHLKVFNFGIKASVKTF
jgi:hypothetical protein